MIKNLFPWNQSPFQGSQQLLELNLRMTVAICGIQTLNPAPANEEQLDLQLQLREDVFMVTHVPSQTVVGWFKSNPCITLLIQGLQSDNKFKKEQEKQTFSKLGMIKFASVEDPQLQISFFFPFDHQKTIELYRILPKTYTIQLNFHNLFTPIRKIGNGATGIVYEVVRKVDQARLAVKAFKKSSYFQAHQGKGKIAFFNEFKILSQCQHQGVCRFEGTYETDNSIYVVQEYYKKSLTSFISETEHLPRKHVLSIMEDLLRAVYYLHSIGIFHRDIKVDNIMLRKQGDAYRPVLIDFGMADRIGNPNLLFPKCGTPGYVPPEVFTEGARDPKGDIFSLGVIFHVLLFKSPVFAGSSKEELMFNNRSGKMALDQTKLESENPLIRDLLLRMLAVNKKDRLSARQALQHKLFRPKGPVTPTTSPPSEIGDPIEPLNFQLIDEQEGLSQ